MTVIDVYCSAWGLDDRGEREARLREALTEDATYTDPRADTAGIAALAAHIGGVLERRPGSHIERTTAVDAHHQWARFGWRAVGADGATVLQGIDIVELAADGKIARVVGFFG